MFENKVVNLDQCETLWIELRARCQTGSAHKRIWPVMLVSYRTFTNTAFLPYFLTNIIL